MSTAVAASAASSSSERLRLLVQPIAAVALVVIVLGFAFGSNPDEVTARSINPATILRLTWQHVQLSITIAAIVLAVAVPLGILLSRRWARWLTPLVLGVANVGQAAPAFGLLVLTFLLTGGSAGFWTAVLPIALYGLLPVLRNTLVGLQQVDPALIDAGRGIGMSSAQVLARIELPLAVPHILAGLRTALVLAVGTVTLAVLVGAGGLGELIDTGSKLNDWTTMAVGAVLSMALALLVDWLGAIVEKILSPKGLR